VILPVLPNQEFGPFQINPFKTWLVVVAVSGVSYGSYVIQKLTKGQGGVILAALLGGAYSSTVTTVVLAKRAARESRPHLFSGGILIASGVMYLRLAGLVTMFNRNLMLTLGVPFAILAGVGVGVGWLWTRIPDAKSGEVKREFEPKNPLELRAAFFFALLFLAILVATHLAVTYLGRAGVYTLAAVMGRHGRGSLHHGHDAIGRPGSFLEGGLGGDSDCRRQQQPGQRDLCLQLVRSQNGCREPVPAGRPDRSRPGAAAMAGAALAGPLQAGEPLPAYFTAGSPTARFRRIGRRRRSPPCS
jgi:hypothetical protein